MARTLSKREGLLIAGLSLAAALWLWKSWGTDTPQAAAQARKAEARRAVAVGVAPVVHMDQLDKAVVAYDGKGRDLFKYSTRPPSWAEVKRMRADAAAAAKAQREAEERARIEGERRAKEDAERMAYLAAHPPPPPPPTPPVVSFQFIGFIGPPGERIAAFEQNNETFLGRTGEVVKRDFKVEEIRYESVLLSYVDPKFKGQVRELPLSRGR